MSSVDYYNKHAKDFVKSINGADISEQLMNFLSYVKNDGKILDAGCGTGRDSKVLLEKGYQVDAFDASEEMCKIASEYTGIKVELNTFEDIILKDNYYDGIFASASLLHVSHNDLPQVFNKLAKSLKNDGAIYVSFKLREEDFSDGIRFFSCFSEESFKAFIDQTSFTIVSLQVTSDSRKDREDEKWINAILKKKIIKNL